MNNSPSIGIKNSYNMKTILIFFLLSLNTLSYAQRYADVSFISKKRDTLYLANNALGREIRSVWLNEDLTLSGCILSSTLPIIILKPETWIWKMKEKKIEK